MLPDELEKSVSGQSGQSISISKFPEPLHILMALTVRTVVLGIYGLSTVLGRAVTGDNIVTSTTNAFRPQGQAPLQPKSLRPLQLHSIHSVLSEHLLYAKHPLENTKAKEWAWPEVRNNCHYEYKHDRMPGPKMPSRKTHKNFIRDSEQNYIFQTPLKTRRQNCWLPVAGSTEGCRLPSACLLRCHPGFLQQASADFMP